MTLELQRFQSILSNRVSLLRDRAREMDQEARLIEVAWASGNIDDLLVLKAIDPVQASELRKLLEDPS